MSTRPSNSGYFTRASGAKKRGASEDTPLICKSLLPSVPIPRYQAHPEQV